MIELIKTLSNAMGVSGHEREVRRLIRDLIQDHVDSWQVDALGNLIAHKKGSGESELKVLVDAHMDEVGFMITGVDSNGTLKFTTVGGFDSRVLTGKVVQVGSKKLPGIIGNKPVHLSSRSERSKIIPVDSMRIDIGASGKDEAKGLVSPGEPATFLTEFEEVGEMLYGKALDDRVGCAILIEMLRQETFPFDLIASFSVQEEVGLRGATVVGQAIQPDVALVLDVTPAYDLPTPQDADESPNVRIGQGAAIYVMDRGTIQDPRLVRHIMRVAEREDLPFQLRRPGGGGTNTASIQRAGVGSSAATISLPGRYMHAPISMISRSDLDNTYALVTQVLKGLDGEVIKR